MYLYVLYVPMKFEEIKEAEQMVGSVVGLRFAKMLKIPTAEI